MPGRRAVEERLPGLRDELGADVCIVNGENVADGAGITGKLADKLLRAGADVVTRIKTDPSLTVGASVIADSTKLGVMLDLSRIEHQALARFTNDAGNHLTVEVHTAAALAAP